MKTIDKEVLEEKEFMKMVEHEMQTGEHIKSPDSAYRGIGNSHFHSVEELEAELDAAGFIDNEVHGIDGGAWFAPDVDELMDDEVSRKALMDTVRMLDGVKSLEGLSTHYLAISRKKQGEYVSSLI